MNWKPKEADVGAPEDSRKAAVDGPASRVASTRAEVATWVGGLSGDEARVLLQKGGPNEMADTAMHPLRMAR
jgi:hypothetical protein